MNEHELDVKKLRKLIDDRGLKQWWVAEHSEITRNYLAQILSGDKKPSNRVWRLLAQTLGVDWTALAKSPNKAKAS